MLTDPRSRFYGPPLLLPDLSRLRNALTEFEQRPTPGAVVYLASEAHAILKAFDPGAPFGYVLRLLDNSPHQWFHLGVSLRAKPQVGPAPGGYEIDGLMLQRPPHDPFYNGG